MTKHHRKRRDPDVPVAAFSDIAFLLIIFFILATTLMQVTGMVAEIPAGEKAEADEEKKTASVEIQGDRVLLDEKHVDMPELRNRLAEMKLHEKTGDAKVVLLEARGDVTYQTYFDVMASISAAGGVTAILQDEE